MTHQFSKVSKSRQNGLHPTLNKILDRAISISSIDFMIIEGVRSDEQCYINYGKGRTASQCKAKGVPAKYAKPSAAKVTWLNNPLSSKHRKQADGYGHAVDVAPYSHIRNVRSYFRLFSWILIFGYRSIGSRKK